jgi:hypothetical protein
MATSSITRKKLSGSTNGKGILVTGTGTGASVTVHLVSANQDELHIWATNVSATVDYTIVIEMAGTTDPQDTIKILVPANTTRKVVDGITLSNTAGTVKAWSVTTGSVLSVFGHVNEIA